MSARSSEVDERDSIREQTLIIRFSTAKAEDSRFCSGVFVDPIEVCRLAGIPYNHLATSPLNWAMHIAFLEVPNQSEQSTYNMQCVQKYH